MCRRWTREWTNRAAGCDHLFFREWASEIAKLVSIVLGGGFAHSIPPGFTKSFWPTFPSSNRAAPVEVVRPTFWRGTGGAFIYRDQVFHIASVVLTVPWLTIEICAMYWALLFIRRQPRQCHHLCTDSLVPCGVSIVHDLQSDCHEDSESR
jgi:hypothetical protein